MNYKNGKIYMLEPKCDYDEGDVYYGTTIQTLHKRLHQHNCNNVKNNCSSKVLFEKYGKYNIKIVLIKEFPCETKEQLFAEEGKYISENKCVNKSIAGRSSKEWRYDNKDKIKKIDKEYYI